MLHKKSEYKQQYCRLNKDLRRQIWEDNILLRKSRLMSNQATQYWEYQMKDGDCSNNEHESEDDEGPLPPHKKKHKQLREQYNHVAEPSQPSSLDPKIAREIAVQTPEWNGDEPDNCARETDDEKLSIQMSCLTLPEPKPKSPMTNRIRPRTGVSLSRTTHTSRKQLADEKKSHFVPFGWNEANKNIGQKQTYNVSAPQKEVHDSAIIADQRRKAEVHLSMAQEKHAKRQTKPQEKGTSSNMSNMWVSEYQEQFSSRSSRNIRPLSAPPAPRRPVTWRHS